MQYYVHVAEYGWRRPPVGSGSKKSKEDKNRAVEEWKQEAAQQVRREATFNNAGGLPPVDDLLVGCVGRLSLIIMSTS